MVKEAMTSRDPSSRWWEYGRHEEIEATLQPVVEIVTSRIQLKTVHRLTWSTWSSPDTQTKVQMK
jgi:hypothetical protein